MCFRICLFIRKHLLKVYHQGLCPPKHRAHGKMDKYRNACRANSLDLFQFLELLSERALDIGKKKILTELSLSLSSMCQALSWCAGPQPALQIDWQSAKLFLPQGWRKGPADGFLLPAAWTLRGKYHPSRFKVKVQGQSPALCLVTCST